MKEIIAKIGWPTISKVGESASYNAWLLVQHAVHDIEFMTECLTLMKSVPHADINPSNLTYLEDRVRVLQGQSQLYGTQSYIKDYYFIPSAIEEEADVDVRRKAIGLPPLKDYFEKLNQLYSTKMYKLAKDN